ncbi:MAG: hypothetical protein IPO83_14465 [Chitinophagaceae bacterium]|nr:hypothetical protein [Chitinophagaceae bacterium]
MEKWFHAILRKFLLHAPLLGLAIICFAHTNISAQDKSVTLKPDSTHIVIGDFLQLKLTVLASDEFMVSLPAVKDTVGKMELVKVSKIDTAIHDQSKAFTQTYTVSAYDSGSYRAGPVLVLFKSKNGSVDSLYSDSFMIQVSTLPVDTSKAFKAIKEPVDVPYTFNEFIPLISGGLLLIAIIIAMVWYFRWRRKNRKPKVIERPKPKDPPHVWARKELKKLEEEKLWQKDEIKQYYSRLTDILRLYLEYRYNWFALESTTEKIREDINDYAMSEDAKKNLLTVLNEGDLVKFAKRIPMPDENVRVLERAYQFVDLTEMKETVKE